MIAPRRLMALAAAGHLMLSAGTAAAQTVLIRNAPPDAAIEVVLNDSPVGTAKADAKGIATVPVDLSTHVMKTETDAQILVDVCKEVRRVLVLERGAAVPQPEPGCVRRDMGGIFVVRQISTLAIDFAGPSPTLMLRQGRVSLDPPRTWGPPTGPVIFGGGAWTIMSNAESIACGQPTGSDTCSGKNSAFGFTAGGAFWIGPYIGAEGSYAKLGEATAEGSGTNYTFDSIFDSEIFTASGLVGGPIGVVRLYGKVGGNYSRSTFRTTQTIPDTTITIDGAPQTIRGGNQVYWIKTAGWGWLFGGGMEVWLAPAFGLYGEFSRAALKGQALDDVEGLTEERVTSVMFGARIRLGGG